MIDQKKLETILTKFSLPKLALTMFLLIFIMKIEMYAQTEVSGIIDSSTTWNLNGSPYTVVGNVMVNGNVTLTIEPGVIIKFRSGFCIQILGELVAKGTSDNKITFTSSKSSPAAGDWGYIYFGNSSTDATFDSIGNYLSGSIIENCIIEYGGYLEGGLYIESSSPLINSNIIRNNNNNGIKLISGLPKLRNNKIESNNGDGIYVSAAPDSICIENCKIVSNKGKGICILNSKFKITGCLVKNNDSYGMDIVDSRGLVSYNIIYNNYLHGIYARGRGTICNNIIISNRLTGIFMYYSGDLSIYNNVIAKNRQAAFVIHPGGGGVNSISNNQIYKNSHLSGSVFSGKPYNSTTTSFSKNTITKNVSTRLSYTISIEGKSVINLNGKNNIFDNTARYDIYNTLPFGSGNINAKNNWWGTSNESEIQAKIFDWNDSGYISVVEFSPYLNSPDTSAPISPPKNIKVSIEGNNIRISWSKNPEKDLKGYKVYYRNFTGYSFDSSVDAGADTSYVLQNVNLTDTIGVTSYDSSADGLNDQIEGHESWYSISEDDPVGLNYYFADKRKQQTFYIKNIGLYSNIIKYYLHSDSYVNISIYNCLGKQTLELVDSYKASGSHHKVFDCRKMSNGLYILKMHTDKEVFTKKFIINK
jgi:parallel beta-helix repeat protein